jgi:RecA/RadA recombinase
MIVELFGPPGSGKTTFARALTARLRERGYVAELKLSWRPSERLPVSESFGIPAERQQNAVINRLRRPLVEMLTIARHPFMSSGDIKVAVKLIRLLPPTNFFSSIKNSQYLSRLSHSWREMSRAGNIIAVFDQGFVQAVCSLALLAGVVDDAVIANALDYAPKSDFSIRLEAPLEVLEDRLADRSRLQSTIERLLEPDLKKCLASIPMIDRLHNLLLQRGRLVLSASSLDQSSLDESLDMIERKIVATIKTRHRGAA